MGIDYSGQIGKKLTTKGDKKRFINMESIKYITCEGYLTTLFLNTGAEIHLIKTLREFEEELFDMGFFRIRNNTIVNGNYITEVDTKNKKRTVKLGDHTFSVAKRRLKSFKAWIS